MRVAILGLGAIGELLVRALDGRAELVGVDRSRAPLGQDEPPVDAAIVATKTPGTAWAADIAAKVLDPEGVALTIQNGLGNHEVLVDRLGPARVAVGVIYVGAGFHADGTHYTTGPGRIQLARPSGPKAAERLDRLVELLRGGGMTIDVVDDPWPAVWRKLVANAVMNAPSALLDASYGEILRDPAKTMLCDALARESARIVTAAGFAYSELEAMEAWRGIARAMTDHRSSMHADLARRRPTEVVSINGALVREAERHGLAAPLNQAMRVLVTAVVANAARDTEPRLAAAR